jgi:hypothetical protein
MRPSKAMIRQATLPRSAAATKSAKSAKLVLAHAAKLPPNDPVAVLAIQPIVNVVETDEDYTMGQNDLAVLASASCTVTLTPSPLTVTPVLVIADGGTVIVEGGANPIQGGPVTITQGIFQWFSFSPLSGSWNVAGAGGGAGAAPTVGSVTFATSPYQAKTTDILVEVNDAGGQCEVIMAVTPRIGVVAIKKTTTNQFSVTVSGGAATIEDPNNPGTWTNPVSIQPGPSGANAVQWCWTGTRWDAVGGF